MSDPLDCVSYMEHRGLVGYKLRRHDVQNRLWGEIVAGLPDPADMSHDDAQRYWNAEAALERFRNAPAPEQKQPA